MGIIYWIGGLQNICPEYYHKIHRKVPEMQYFYRTPPALGIAGSIAEVFPLVLHFRAATLQKIQLVYTRIQSRYTKT